MLRDIYMNEKIRRVSNNYTHDRGKKNFRTTFADAMCGLSIPCRQKVDAG
jgi:hypothetical protein